MPFDALSAQDVFNAFARAGLEIQNPEKKMTCQRARRAERLQRPLPVRNSAHRARRGADHRLCHARINCRRGRHYIDKLRGNSDTRRDVVYIYVKDNVMLQLSANLTNAEAKATATR